MDENPYASPAALDEFVDPSVESAGQPYKLYSAGHVAWATFLGSPIAGCLLMAFNYWRLGKARLGQLIIACGVVATCCLLAVGFVLPERFPDSIFAAAFTFGMYGIAKSLQGEAVERHLESGGQTASAWRATGVGFMGGIAVGVFLFAVGMVLAIAFPAWFGE